MSIDKVMTRQVVACGPEDSVAEAARIMWEHDCGFVPVVDAKRIPVGVLTDRDICMAAYTRGLRLHEMSARSVMSTRLCVCTRDASLGAVEQLMAAAQVRRLPVVDDAGALVGIVSLGDLARARSGSPKDRVAEHLFADVAKTLAAIPKPHATPVISAE